MERVSQGNTILYIKKKWHRVSFLTCFLSPSLSSRQDRTKSILRTPSRKNTESLLCCCLSIYKEKEQRSQHLNTYRGPVSFQQVFGCIYHSRQSMGQWQQNPKSKAPNHFIRNCWTKSAKILIIKSSLQSQIAFLMQGICYCVVFHLTQVSFTGCIEQDENRLLEISLFTELNAENDIKCFDFRSSVNSFTITFGYMSQQRICREEYTLIKNIIYTQQRHAAALSGLTLQHCFCITCNLQSLKTPVLVAKNIQNMCQPVNASP